MKQFFLFLCLMLANLKNVSSNCSLSDITVRKYMDQNDGSYNDVLWARNNFKGAEILAIHDQDFPELCTNAFSCTNVVIIRFYDNLIDEIKPGAFANIHGLEKLYLTMCGLKEIKGGIFNGLGMLELDLHSNQITNIAGDAFDDMRNLRSLILSNNKLRKVNSQWFAGTPQLSWVSLDINSIDALPEGSIGFPTKPEHPVAFNLENNLIRKIEPRAFQNFTMNSLHLNRNRLTTIPENMFLNVKSANFVVLSRNSIKCLDDRVLNTLKMVKKIIFNNIVDNCYGTMKKWGDKNGVEIIVT